MRHLAFACLDCSSVIAVRNVDADEIQRITKADARAETFDKFVLEHGGVEAARSLRVFFAAHQKHRLQDGCIDDTTMKYVPFAIPQPNESKDTKTP